MGSHHHGLFGFVRRNRINQAGGIGKNGRKERKNKEEDGERPGGGSVQKIN
jgi:hypothetical protein